MCRMEVRLSALRLSALLTLLFTLSGGLQAQATGEDLVRSFRWRNIGPATMMGRVSSIDALNSDYRTVLIGSASGGVFKSTNAGNTWTSIFDDYGSQSIGDVAFFQGDPEIIWIGTGEATNRNSVGWGDGIYRSTDLACFAGGQAVGQFLPRSSRVRGSVDAAVRPAAVHAGRGAQPLVHPDEQDVRVVRAHRDDCGAGASIIGKPVRELFPRLAAVRRLVQPSCP